MINELHTANCVDFMESMTPESVDLTVTSPPYDKMRDYKGYQFDYKSVIDGLFRITKPGGVVVWVVADQSTINDGESGTSFRQALFFMEIGFNLHDTMIYSKPPRGALGGGLHIYRQCFEYMFVFSKGRPKTVNLIKDRKNKRVITSMNVTQRREDGVLKQNSYNGHGEYGVRRNIWDIHTGYNKATKDKIAYQHPAIFPEKLAYDHVISWSNPGDLVFDPMCGSGTTCKMAKMSGRHYLGCDISSEYIGIAQQRLDSVLL